MDSPIEHRQGISLCSRHVIFNVSDRRCRERATGPGPLGRLRGHSSSIATRSCCIAWPAETGPQRLPSRLWQRLQAGETAQEASQAILRVRQTDIKVTGRTTRQVHGHLDVGGSPEHEAAVYSSEAHRVGTSSFGRLLSGTCKTLIAGRDRHRQSHDHELDFLEVPLPENTWLRPC